MDLDHSLRGRPYEARRNERDARLGGRKGDPRHQGMAPKPKDRWRAATAALLNRRDPVDPMPDKQSRTDRAEATFKRRESDTGGLTEHQAANQAIRDKTARLRALRLAKEAADGLEAESSPQLMSRSAKTKA